MKLSNVLLVIISMYVVYDTLLTYKFNAGSTDRETYIIKTVQRINDRLDVIDNNQRMIIREMEKVK
jgi:hypothetical protein